VFRLRVESLPARWRPFRWSVYLLILGVAPLGIAGAVSIGGRFGIGILALLPFMYGLSVFGVEFTIRTGRKPQEFEFNADGIHISGPGPMDRRFRWQSFRVKLQVGGRRGAPTLVVFRFRSGMHLAMLAIDLLRYRDMAERIAGFVARHAPEARRSGRVDVVRWDPSLATDGSMSIIAPGFDPLFYAALGVFGPAFGVYMTASVILIGLVADRVLGLSMAGSYVALGVAQLAYCRRAIRGGIASRADLSLDGRTRALLLAGLALVGVEGLLSLRIWLG